MASIRKRAQSWQAQIRRAGSPPQARSFATKKAAEAWARGIELEADLGGIVPNRRILNQVTLADILVRYRDTITPTKRGCVRETFAINVLLRNRLAHEKLKHLTVARVAQYRDDRAKEVKPASVNRELAIYQHALAVARKNWGMPLPENPFAQIRKLKVVDARTRRLNSGEWEQLECACARSRNPCIRDLVEFAVATGMRRAEMLNARWRDVDFDDRTLLITTTKNGQPRTIPLSGRALAILQARRRGRAGDDLVFPTTDHAVRMAWRRVMGRIRLPDFRFHDLRHEAISRFFEAGLSVPEVALLSGHRDPRMLFRYTHPRPEDVADKLRGL
jgi:integrase